MSARPGSWPPATRAVAVALLALTALVAACANNARSALRERRADRDKPRNGEARAVPADLGSSLRVPELRPSLQGDGFGPEVLEPPPAVDDAVIARIGDVEIHKSHIFDRLLQMDPSGARDLRSRLARDALIAQYARRHGITVTAEEIEDARDAEEQAMRRAIAAQSDPTADPAEADPSTVSDESFGEFLEATFGLTLEDYRRVARLELARVRYRGYVVRYLPMLEEQVVVRGLWNRDRALVEQLAKRVSEGADIASLARRHSDHPSAREGGLLPPLGAGFRTPVAVAALGLSPGEVSDVIRIESSAGEQFAFFYCLERRAPRDEPFAELRDEIRGGLDERPISQAEQEAFMLRWVLSEAELDTTPSETGR